MSEDGIAHLILENSNRTVDEKKHFTPDHRMGEPDSNANRTVENLVAKEKQRGFEQGYQEGLSKVEQEWALKISQLTELVSVLENLFSDIDEEIRNKTLEIAIAIAKQIIRRELVIDSGQIVAAIKQAIELIPKDDQQIDIFINPSDEQHIQNLFAENGGSKKFNIVSDPTVSAGGCRASTDYSLVDLTIEKQIATIASQLLGEQRKSSE